MICVAQFLIFVCSLNCAMTGNLGNTFDKAATVIQNRGLVYNEPSHMWSSQDFTDPPPRTQLSLLPRWLWLGKSAVAFKRPVKDLAVPSLAYFTWGHVDMTLRGLRMDLFRFQKGNNSFIWPDSDSWVLVYNKGIFNCAVSLTKIVPLGLFQDCQVLTAFWWVMEGYIPWTGAKPQPQQWHC